MRWVNRLSSVGCGVAIVASVSLPVWAKETKLGQVTSIAIASDCVKVLSQPPCKNVKSFTKNVTQLLAQTSLPNAQIPVQVTGVKLNNTAAGVEVILETPQGERLQPVITQQDNTLIADIPNAVLVLPESSEFRADNPVAGITAITVTNQDASTIQVTVTGEFGVPVVELFDSDTGLIFGVTPEQTATNDEQIEIVVTGEQEAGYSVPNASTATRTDTPLRDIPFSVQVLPEQVLQDQQSRSVTDAIRNVPGTVIVNPPQFVSEEFFIIRGFEGDTTINGLRDTTIGTTGSALANIEQIEVLRGPAGALFGAGAPGGTVNIVTKRPQSRPFYKIEGSVGSFDTYEGAIDLTGSLTSDATLLYRLTASASQLGNEGVAPASERYFVAPALTWLIGDRTSVTFAGEYFSGWSPDGFGLPANGTIFENPKGDIPRDRYLGEPSFDQNDRQVWRGGYEFEHRFSANWQLRHAFRASLQQFEEDVVSGVELLEDNRTLIRSASFNDAYRNVYLLDTNIVGNFETGSIAHQLLFGFDLSTDFFEVNFGDVDIAPIDLFNPVYGAQTIGEIQGGNPPYSQMIDRLGL
ncbi:TonB-dependent receptor plug [Gloeocapsa sp. PCC 7428]|uniref:TonB-dependent receptor domain-containing protein n=1 Tax=Gloeocapsa sp. PCC 7428 TaxID=1173026 RepID=UPI0002A5F2BE|nr:TonB-dependent receptor [Gloeocapsa sp. PCC 7428]AFZ28890.1 TonB-dependent receptor plug [Gloeocapsa sp. PCC 7428]